MLLKNEQTWIDAIDATIAKHKACIKDGVRYGSGRADCPLCQAAKDKCTICPWFLMPIVKTPDTFMPCVDGVSYSDSHKSIKRLRKWRRAYIKSLKERQSNL
jgi:DNA-binding helix-hairpin-helix protein with protein kinase domain